MAHQQPFTDTLKDLPVHGKRVGVYVMTRRYQCQTCNVTFYEPLPDVDEKRIPK